MNAHAYYAKAWFLLVDSNDCAPKMGQSESSFKRNYEDSVSQLSSVQLKEITTHFNEVYAKAGGSKGHLVDREAFSKYFKLPVTVGERLFEAFDAHKVRSQLKGPTLCSNQCTLESL